MYFMMRKLITLSFIVIVIGLMSLPSISVAAISVSVSPTSALADDTTGFTLQTQAATPGGGVQFEIFNDFNNNGTIDADEWPMLNMVLEDNGQGRNGEELLAADSEPSSPGITKVWNLSKCNVAYLPVGNFIIRVKTELGESATNQFTVTPAFA